MELGVESPRKRPKIIKDAPVFTRGATRGEVRYPPFVYSSATHSQSDSHTHTHSDSNSANEDNNDDDGDNNNDGSGGESEIEAVKNNLQVYHDQFKLYPRQEDVAEYPRFIPYNSERRVFADATGRDFFEGMSVIIVVVVVVVVVFGVVVGVIVVVVLLLLLLLLPCAGGDCLSCCLPLVRVRVVKQRGALMS